MYATTRRFRPAWAGLTAAAMCALLSACSSGSREETLAAQQANGTGTTTGTPSGTGTTTGTGTTGTTTPGSTTSGGTSTSGGTGTTMTTAPAGSGIVRVSLTDAPSCGFTAVNVTVAAVRLNTNGNAAPTDSGWIDIPVNPPQRVNLLDLQNGALLRLGETTAPEGTYDQIRLVLAPNPATAGAASTTGATTTAGAGGATGTSTGGAAGGNGAGASGNANGAANASGTGNANAANGAGGANGGAGTNGAAGGTSTGTTSNTGVTAGTAGATGTPTTPPSAGTTAGTAGTTGTGGTAGTGATTGTGTPTAPAAGTTPTAATSGTTLANSVVPQGGGEVALETPSALSSGIKVAGPGIRVTNATPAEVALDFDACRSIVTRGNGSYLMTPVVRGIPLAAAGTIVGNIDPAAGSAGGATVSAQSGQGDVLRTAAVNPDGSFTLAATPAGTGLVNVVIQAPSRSAAVITDVPVTIPSAGGSAGTFVTSVPTGTTATSGTSATATNAGTAPNAGTGTTTSGTTSGTSGTPAAGTTSGGTTNQGTTVSGTSGTTTAGTAGTGATTGTSSGTTATPTSGTSGPTTGVTRLSTAQTPIALPASETRTATGIVSPLNVGAMVRALGIVGSGRFETAFGNVDPGTGNYTLTLPFAPIVTGNYNAQGQLNLVPAAPTTGGIYDLQAMAPGYVPQTLPANVSTVPAVQNFTLAPVTP